MGVRLVQVLVEAEAAERLAHHRGDDLGHDEPDEQEHEASEQVGQKAEEAVEGGLETLFDLHVVLVSASRRRPVADAVPTGVTHAQIRKLTL
jgi:hypothetical protein